MRKELGNMDIKVYLKEKREMVDSFLQSYFESCISPALLNDAMAYSVFAGGKREPRLRGSCKTATRAVVPGHGCPLGFVARRCAVEDPHFFAVVKERRAGKREKHGRGTSEQ